MLLAEYRTLCNPKTTHRLIAYTDRRQNRMIAFHSGDPGDHTDELFEPEFLDAMRAKIALHVNH